MEDFRTFIAVDYNFDVKQTIAENQTLKQNNQVLLTAAVLVGICFIGVAIYVIREENKNKFYYIRNQE
jgi:hypothetical protein